MAKKEKIEQPEARPLDISAAMAKRPRNRIARIGLELEGAWKVFPPGIQELQIDTSVFKSGGGQVPPAGYSVSQLGELALGPMQPAYLVKALKINYPTKVNETCGLHVHMSLETVYQYALLMDSPAYQETVIAQFAKWGQEENLPPTHPLWGRLEGKSAYCQKKFWPQEQIQATRKDHDREREGHRYTMIHYAWGRFKTVECRILPMMETVEQATRAVKRLLDVTNAYLVTVDRKKAKVTGSIKLDNGDIYEEYVETRL